MKNQLLLLLIIILSSCKKDCIEVQVPVTRYEDYETTEEKTITLDYDVIYSRYNRIPGSTLFGDKPKIKTRIAIYNSSDYDGEFRTEHKYETTLDEIIRLEGVAYINAHDTVEIELQHEIDDYLQFKLVGYNVFPPSKTVMVPVIKQREIIEWRPCNTCVEDCETLLK